VKFQAPYKLEAMKTNVGIIIIFTTLIGLSLSSLTSINRTFTIKNLCTQSIWVAAPGVPGHTGFQLTPGAVTQFLVSPTWGGRIWGQSGCSFDANGNLLSCQTCPTGSKCTLTEFTLGGWNDLDFYDISLVDGYTVPTSIFTDVPSTPGQSIYSCGNATCILDVSTCPPELQIKNSDGSLWSCENVCSAVSNATQVALYPILATVKSAVLTCCGTRNTTICNPNTWPVSSTGVNYYQIFKSQCTTSYAYADDDGTSTYTCAKNANYTITFCPPPVGGGTTTTTTTTTKAPTATATTTTTTTTKAPTATTTTATTTTKPTSTPTPKPASTPTPTPTSGVTCSSVIANRNCYGLSGGKYQPNASACANQCCASSTCKTWSWNTAAAQCWTGTASSCKNVSSSGSTWYSGGALVQAEQVSASLTWYKSQGYWIVGVIVIGVILFILLVVLFSRSRRSRSPSEFYAGQVQDPEPVLAPTSSGQNLIGEQPPTPQAVSAASAGGLEFTSLATSTPEWTSAKDESGNTYYQNTRSGVTQWEVPDGFQPTADNTIVPAIDELP